MTMEVSIRKRLGDDFTLAVDFLGDGESLGILGASGSGKSMTLKCIAGVETPDQGRIAVNGRVLFDSAARINVRPQQRRVGYLFQNYALFPRMTVEENIGIGAVKTGAEKRGAVAGLIRGFHLDGLEKRFPGQLSGGQQQRAALARMLAAEPEIILLDEPFSALDNHLREQMQLEFLDLMRTRRDVVMVTHNRNEAYKLCRRLMVLDEGRILGMGDTGEVFRNPGHVRVARLTGCKNISRMEKTGERTLYALDWGLSLSASRPIPDNAVYIGVRAHDLAPVYRNGADMPNCVRMKVVDESDDVFERNILFRNADGGAPSEKSVLWWRFSKYLFTDPPAYMHIPPDTLLFLHDG